ncbi:glycosyltransferase [Candidatus Peregrinibacteria bacterium]|nr:glycosyltransferase [Candidatus Peregrinibacteria bacterium]
MKKILIATDVWKNINGVVTSIKQLKEGLEKRNFKVKIVHPAEFRNVPLLTDRDIKLAILSRRRMEKIIKKFKPDYLHIATEGPVGFAARLACGKNKWKFTSQYHTQLPEYIEIRIRTGLLKNATYRYLRWFHGAGEKTMVSSPLFKNLLEKRKFKNVTLIPLGVDVDKFKKNPRAKTSKNLKKPIFTFLGRVTTEKNLPSFLKCKLPGTKLIIGDGSAKKSLEKKFKKDTVFVGCKSGRELVDLLSISDVFVFPSKTDTFGLAMLEALACEVPVAAYNVTGPKDIVTSGFDGYLGPNLGENALRCLKLKKANCRKKALKFSAKKWCDRFIKNLSPV